MHFSCSQQAGFSPGLAQGSNFSDGTNSSSGSNLFQAHLTDLVDGPVSQTTARVLEESQSA